MMWNRKISSKAGQKKYKPLFTILMKVIFVLT